MAFRSVVCRPYSAPYEGIALCLNVVPAVLGVSASDTTSSRFQSPVALASDHPVQTLEAPAAANTLYLGAP